MAAAIDRDTRQDVAEVLVRYATGDGWRIARRRYTMVRVSPIGAS